MEEFAGVSQEVDSTKSFVHEAVGIQGHHINQPAPFNLWAALIEQNDIMFHLATRFLEPRVFLTLYTISRRFHYLVNSNYSTYILESARTWTTFPSEDQDTSNFNPSAPYTTLLQISPYTSHKNLCITDPSHRGRPTATTTAPTPSLPQHTTYPPEQPTTAVTTRCIPTFRYLQLLLHRHRTILSLLHLITSTYSHPLPRRATYTLLAKLWYMLDAPTNVVRIALAHNAAFFRTAELPLALLFFVKLDLVLTDPVDGAGQTLLRKMLLAQRGGLTALERWLRREEGLRSLDAMRMWLRWVDPGVWMPEQGEQDEQNQQGGRSSPQAIAQMSVMGIPAAELGAVGREGWGAGAPRLVGCEELLVMEAVRRGLRLEEMLVDAVVWGYVEAE